MEDRTANVAKRLVDSGADGRADVGCLRTKRTWRHRRSDLVLTRRSDYAAGSENHEGGCYARLR